MHIAAVDPRYVRREDVTQEMLEDEKEIYTAQARATGKPEPVIQKIVQGKMEKRTVLAEPAPQLSSSDTGSQWS